MKSVLLTAILILSWKARGESLPKRWLHSAASMIGCAKYFASPLNAEVAQFVQDHAEHTRESIDKDDGQTHHIFTHIYKTKEADNKSGIEPEEFNFYATPSEIIVVSWDSTYGNRAYRILSIYGEQHFPYAKITQTEAKFGIEHFPQFIKEIENLGFKFR